MTKRKSTKRALLMSALSLLMCISMLVGSTFAWFTDSVTSAGNIIQSGTLDVDMVDADGNSMAGQVIEFVTADNRPQDQILWEPGCTYKTEPIQVVNKGNLALKYEIHINGIDGNAKLLEAIEWTVTIGGVETDLASYEGKLYPEAGQDISGEIVLSGHMKEEAGNEYQGLKAEGISIVVYATQLTAENDSFNDQYDAAAEYAAATMLKKVAAVAAGESATVKLESDGYVVLSNANPIGAKVAGDVTVDLNGKTLFVKVEDGNAHKSLFNILRNGKLTVTGNGTIEMLTGKNDLVTAIFNNTSGELVIENGTYKMDHLNNWQDALIPTLIDNNGNAAGATTTINGGNFYHTRCMFRNFPSNNGITQLTINGGTFNGKADDWAVIWNQKASSSTNEGQSLITVNGGTFNYVEIDNEFKTGVTIKDEDDVVCDLISGAADLSDALANGGNVIMAGDLNFNASETSANSGYGATGVSVKGGTLNGNGNSIGINNWGTWDAAVHTTGGTIKNLTINSGMRGIFMGSATEDVYIDNVVIDGTIYTFNSDGGNMNYGVYISNSTLNGWTSHSDVHKEVVYTNCDFGEGNGYAFCRPYGPTSFVGCDFEAGFRLDAIGEVTFKNCTIGGVALTAANLSTLVTSNIANASVIG